jgi:hypothetical protein
MNQLRDIIFNTAIKRSSFPSQLVACAQSLLRNIQSQPYPTAFMQREVQLMSRVAFIWANCTLSTSDAAKILRVKGLVRQLTARNIFMAGVADRSGCAV